MTIDRRTLLFFDASCLIAAAGNPKGGSGFLLSICAQGFLKGAVSQPVLLEAQRNIDEKLGEAALNRFYRFLVIVPFILAPVPPKSDLMQYERIVTEKDTHVVAAAEAVSATFLLTLDKRLTLQANQANFKVQTLSPGEFIKLVLPKHTNFP